MRRLRQLAFWAAVAALITGAVISMLISREPAYQGKGLTAWMEDLDIFYAIKEPERVEKAEEAIRQMGTNVMPHLLRMLAGRESRLKVLLMRLFAKQSTVPVSFTLAHTRKERAIHAIRALGPAATPYIPQLSELAYDERTAPYGARALAGVGTDAVPPLINALNSQHLQVRASAALALALLRSDAKSALPTLSRLATEDAADEVRRQATAAVEAIDPEAAKELR